MQRPENPINKFVRVEDPSKHTSCRLHAIIKVWKIDEKDKRIKCASTYHFCDPVILEEETFDTQPIQKIIHTTVDGEAYLLQKKHQKPTEIFVIDQEWSLNMGPLPPQAELNARLNSKSVVDASKPKTFDFL